MTEKTCIIEFLILMETFSTPMMRQYHTIKKQYPDCLLFYRMGDFYELFNEDAHTGARILNITLTAKAGGKDGKIPMAGVPYHAVDGYIAKLVKAGYKVAICEQLSPPNKKGLVERDVVRIVTPGTLLDENSLEKKENNYIVSLIAKDGSLGLAASDLSTGYFATNQFESDTTEKLFLDELAKLDPSECILPDYLYNDTDFLKSLRFQRNMNIFPYSAFETIYPDANKYLCKHFSVKTLAGFGIKEKPLAIQAAGALLSYLTETQKRTVTHIKKLSILGNTEGLTLDRSTIINLELFSTIREHDTRGSLLSVLDSTQTAMGGRLLRQWIKKPLTEKKEIEERFDALEKLIDTPDQREILKDQLKQIPDIERLLSRLSVNLGNARDLVNLKLALHSILQTKIILKKLNTPLLTQQATSISDALQTAVERIETVIVDEPPIITREGRMIKQGVNQELDTLRKVISKSKDWLIELEKTEKEKTGIGSLKVRFNKVFGFYIEISKTNVHLVPENYMRKQTLVNGERYITKELKEHEEIILNAEEKTNELEYKIFIEVLSSVLSFTNDIQNAAESIAVVDCLVAFSTLSERERFVRPKLLCSGEIRIKEGRHPVVEQLLEDTSFVPNDVTLDNINQSLLLITGPNMAGKSVFLRQVALIVLMAQIGCFVPAKSAHISLVDRIFVRSGASDVITSGLSTFMVEMVETAHILNNATKNSLIIMDEIGRGTSTYDGISIAWAVAEYLVKHFKPAPKVLFATHYHELQALEEQYPKQIRNFHMAVTDQDGEPIFLHTILPGGASHSFGVAVAKLAGVPQPVIERANSLLSDLETRGIQEIEITEEPYSIKPHLLDRLLHKELDAMDVANMTPLEALNKLAQLKENVKLVTEKFKEVD